MFVRFMRRNEQIIDNYSIHIITGILVFTARRITPSREMDTKVSVIAKDMEHLNQKRD